MKLLEFEHLEFEHSEFENSELKNSELKNSEFENSDSKLKSERAIFRARIRFKNFLGPIYVDNQLWFLKYSPNFLF